MTENITVKIKKAMGAVEEDNKKHALYEVEPFNYDDRNYSLIQIEYQNESDLKEFVEGKSIKIEVGENITKRGGGFLVISGGNWNADRTVWQQAKDKAKETADKIGDASSEAVKKTGEGLEKVGKNFKESANEKQWPRWVLPVIIVVGIIALMGIIVWIFKPNKR